MATSFGLGNEPDIIGEDIPSYTQEDVQKAVKDAGYLDAPPEFSQQGAIAQLEADLMNDIMIRDQLREEELLGQQNVKTLDRDLFTKEVGESIAYYEGYSPNLPMNVPSKTSGVTIAGVDLSSFSGDMDEFLNSLEQYGNPGVAAKLKGAVGLKGDNAKNYLKNNNITINLSKDAIAEIPAKALTSYEDKLKKGLGEDNYNALPNPIKVPLLSLTWLNYGPKSIAALKKAIKSGKREDWLKAVSKYENYWNNSTAHNQRRSQDVADAIKKYIK